jgi:hypothetical protein
MTRAIISAPNIVLGVVVIAAVAALAWAATTNRTTFEDAGRFFPIDQYESAARLERLTTSNGPELRIWARQDKTSEVVTVGHVIRPSGMASFWLMRNDSGGIGPVTSTIEQDPGMRASFEQLLADLRALDPMWGDCGWDDPDYEVEAIYREERLHFRFDQACVERTGAFGRLVELVGA